MYHYRISWEVQKCKVKGNSGLGYLYFLDICHLSQFSSQEHLVDSKTF